MIEPVVARNLPRQAHEAVSGFGFGHGRKVGHAPVFSVGLCARVADILGSRGDRVVEMVIGEKRNRSEEHTSELQSLMRISYAVFCLTKKTTKQHTTKLASNTRTSTGSIECNKKK